MAIGAIGKRPQWVILTGRIVPLSLAGIYAFIAPLYFTTTTGNFESLAGLAAMFADPWLTLGGWLHWMAADLFIGSYIVGRVLEKGWYRAWLFLLMPLCAMVAPLGFLAYHAVWAGYYVRRKAA